MFLKILVFQVYAVASEDMDSLTFGSPRFLRHLMDPSSRKIPVMEFEVAKVICLHLIWLFAFVTIHQIICFILDFGRAEPHHGSIYWFVHSFWMWLLWQYPRYLDSTCILLSYWFFFFFWYPWVFGPTYCPSDIDILLLLCLCHSCFIVLNVEPLCFTPQVLGGWLL